MLDRDRVVPLAPDDQSGQLPEQVEAVHGADVLAANVDHRAQRLQEGPPGGGLLEGSYGASDGLEIDAPAAASRSHALARSLDRRANPAVCDQPEPGGSSGQGGPAQQRAHLMAQAAAGDQGEALDALGELVEELHRDPAAERVAHDGGALDPDGRQQVPDAAGVGAEGVIASDSGGVAVAEQVRGHDRVAVG